MSDLKELLEDASRRSIAYREASESRRIAPDDKALAALDAFNEKLSEHGASASDTIAMLDEIGSPAAVSMTSSRYFGFVIGGSMPVALAANWIASAWDQNAAMHEVTTAVSVLEQVSINWMVDLLGLPEGTGAGFVTGATVANFTSLAAARNQVLRQAGWDVRADGLFGAPEITVFTGAEAHPTLLKALSMLGLGERRIHTIDVDKQGRMLARQLRAIDGPCIVCAQAGNINSGAFDPFDEIADRTGDNTWLHIDGAFGLWAAASQELRHLCKGIDRADSWATDAHKWLNVPYDSGIAFIRDDSTLRSAMSITAEYINTETEFRNPSDYTPELSRRARGVDVWAALRTLGRSGLADMIERCCRHARRFADELSTAGFQILNDVVLNQVLVSFGDDEKTLRIIDALQKDGTCWCGSTVWQGQTAMRISVSNWSTMDDDVTASLEVMIRLARETG